MKIRNIFSFETLKISFPFGITIPVALLIFPFLLLVIEGLLRVFPISETVLVPSIDRVINYSEIDIKFSRLAAMGKEKKINCFLLGNSMVDFGLNPSILNSQSKLWGIQNPSCFNMALEAMMPETSSEIAGILKKRFNPAVIILGLSPVDFVGNEYVTRKFNSSHWFRYQAGIFSTEGWWIENSETYKYWLSFRKYRNPEYRSDVANLNLLIDHNGFQIREKDNQIFQVQKKLKFPSFGLAESDLSAFLHFMDINSKETQIIVIEMPVHPDFLPYYVPGGKEGYENLFIQPIQKTLDEKGIPFIRTQPYIADIVTPDGWIDYSHLNEKGANQFSQWLAVQLGQ